MSRVYFHTPTDEAELQGAEGRWLLHIGSGPGTVAWDLTGALNGYERAVEIMAMAPDEPADDGHGSGYLHNYLRDAQQQEADNRAVYAASELGDPYPGRTGFEPQARFVGALQTALRGSGVDFRVAGHHLNSRDVELNTALIAGSDVIRLAAKIGGWCTQHCWVDGPDRAWMAGIIGQGLAARLYRPGMGWETVRDFLLARDDEPVVLSDSIGDQFPRPDIGGWMPPWPEGVELDWWALTGKQREERSARSAEWYDLPDDERWRIAMEALRERRPWARLAPDTLATVGFGPTVTVYDLLAPDREDRVRGILDAD